MHVHACCGLWREDDFLPLGVHELLRLRTYYTSGETETKAWTITEGTLAPQAAGAYSCDQFLLRAAGACAPAALTLAGTARGPEVTAEPAVLAFGAVRAGERESHRRDARVARAAPRHVRLAALAAPALSCTSA